MASRNRLRGSYVYVEDSTEVLSTADEAAKQREASLYDAVAGLVSHKFSKDDATGGSRKTASGQHHLGDPVLAPEEVLFSRKRAPQRYAEKDMYFANESLPDAGRNILPESDMVKELHAYASHFYEAPGSRCAGEPRGHIGRVNHGSMEGTALLAFGILLEELAQGSLGKDGDLVFTEGIGTDDDGGHDRGDQQAANTRRVQTLVGFEGEDAFWKRPYSKRRKIKDERD